MSIPCNSFAGATRCLRFRQPICIPIRASTTSFGSRTAASTKSMCTNESLWSKRRTFQRSEARNECWAQSQSRPFSSSLRRQKLKTVQQVQARNKGGPFNIAAGLLFITTGGILYYYFTQEKARMERKRIAEQTKGVGKPKVGGPFTLIDHDGNPFSHVDLLGRYALVYFGFTHCPDICPDELDKMAIMYDKVVAKRGDVLVPIMITCDPVRDSPAVLKEYLKEFHPAIIGLTGEYEDIKQTCKAYRVYFSTPPALKPGQDYLVDHSIYFYLMDPEGDFVEALGRNFTADQAAKVISDHIGDWEKPLKKKARWD